MTDPGVAPTRAREQRPCLVRPARPSDVPAVVAMVHELAAYERAADQCRLTDDQLRAALFAERPALFGHVALAAPAAGGGQRSPAAGGGQRSPAAEGGQPSDDGEPIGFALWFLNFSTWEGVHGIYLEDLYVRPTARGLGAGRALLAALAATCVERGYRRLEWWVLHWNPARQFYDAIGAVAMDEWVPYRVEGDALRTLAMHPRLAVKP